MISETVGYSQRMFVENLDEARRITFGRGVHGSGRIDARDHDKGAPLDPGPAVYIDMVDHLNNLAWNIWSKNRFDLGGTRNRQLGVDTSRSPKKVRDVRWLTYQEAETAQSELRGLPFMAPNRCAEPEATCPFSGAGSTD
jgi:hypothetical protein